jgi:hypothetical protein
LRCSGAASRGWGRAQYLIDHHHTCLALLFAEGIKEKSVYYNVRTATAAAAAGRCHSRTAARSARARVHVGAAAPV